MMRYLRSVAIAAVFPLIIVGLVLSDDAAQRRLPINQGMAEMVDQLVVQDQKLSADSIHLEALWFDERINTLKRLQGARRARDAEALAKLWLVEFYQQRLAIIDQRRGEVDLYLGTLASAGQSEERILAELQRLLGDPLSRAQDDLQKAKATPPPQALSAMLAYYEACYQERIKRARLLRGEAS